MCNIDNMVEAERTKVKPGTDPITRSMIYADLCDLADAHANQYRVAQPPQVFSIAEMVRTGRLEPLTNKTEEQSKGRHGGRPRCLARWYHRVIE